MSWRCRRKMGFKLPGLNNHYLKHGKQGPSLQKIQTRAEALFFLKNFQMNFSPGVPCFGVIQLHSLPIYFISMLRQRMWLRLLFSCAKLNSFPLLWPLFKIFHFLLLLSVSANLLLICRWGHFIFYFMQWIFCQGNQLPFFAARVLKDNSLHYFFHVNFSQFVGMGGYGEHKETRTFWIFSGCPWWNLNHEAVGQCWNFM